MQRLIMYVLGLGVVVLVVATAAKSMPTHASLVASDGGAPLVSDAAVPSGQRTSGDAGLGLGSKSDVPAGEEPHGDTPLLAIPPTPGSSRQVRVGIVLVQYDGAQGAGPKARSKKDAQIIAQKLADEARADFRDAVQHGDTGSSDDIGHIQRGVLDAPTESVLFALPVGGVSDVIDTPRGFWIAKRIE
jgi:hypothetical protein